jgi:hypothetical protein
MKRATIYRPAAGAFLSADDAAVLGREFDRILKKYGELTPALVVSEAQDTKSVLHRFFEWDHARAAERHWVATAGRLIRSVRIVVKQEKREPTLARAFVSVVADGNRRSYKPMAVAMTNAEWRRQLLDEALQAFDAMARKYSQLEELADVFAALAKTRRRRG